MEGLQSYRTQKPPFWLQKAACDALFCSPGSYVQEYIPSLHVQYIIYVK